MNLRRQDIPLFVLFLSPSMCGAFMAIAFLARGDVGAFFIGIFDTVLFGVLGITFFNVIRNSRAKSKTELKQDAIYSETCGARIGMMNYSWPLARVAVFDGFLIVKANIEAQLFPQDIWNIKTLSRIGYAGIQIQHTRKDIPLPIIVWTWYPVLLRDGIEKGLHLKEMPQYGKEPNSESLSEHERQERRKYPWLQ